MANNVCVMINLDTYYYSYALFITKAIFVVSRHSLSVSHSAPWNCLPAFHVKTCVELPHVLFQCNLFSSHPSLSLLMLKKTLSFHKCIFVTVTNRRNANIQSGHCINCWMQQYIAFQSKSEQAWNKPHKSWDVKHLNGQGHTLNIAYTVL